MARFVACSQRIVESIRGRLLHLVLDSDMRFELLSILRPGPRTEGSEKVGAQGFQFKAPDLEGNATAKMPDTRYFRGEGHRLRHDLLGDTRRLTKDPPRQVVKQGDVGV